MKKTLILLTSAILLVLTINTTGKAQNTYTTQFGVKGGVNFSNLYTKDADKNQSMTGFNIGLFSKMPVSGNFAFQPEIYFTTKGAEVTYNNTFVDGTASFKFNYVEMPLLFVLNVTDHFSIQVGPYAAYLVSGKVKNKSNINLFDFEDNIKPEDYNRFDAGIAGGVSLDFKSVSFGARYSYGLTKVGKEKTFLGTTYTFPDANNSVLSLYAQIPLQKN